MTAVSGSCRRLRPPLARLRASWPGRCRVRAFRCWLADVPADLAASVWSSVLGPLFYLGAMGYGLGSLVDKNGTAAPRRRAATWCSSRPAVLAVQAMNTGLTNSMFPVFGAMRWNTIYLAARATLLRPADIYRGHLLFITMRIAMNSACFVVLMAAFGLIRSSWAVLLLPAACCSGLAFAAPVAAWTVTLQTTHPDELPDPVRRRSR